MSWKMVTIMSVTRKCFDDILLLSTLVLDSSRFLNRETIKECDVMKYCPFCGATLYGGAASFCPECGKQIPPKPQTESESPVAQAEAPALGTPTDKLSRTQPRKKQKKGSRKEQSKYTQQDDGYDGYYDDVPTSDNGHEREELDPEIIKKICLIIGGALVIIGLSVALMLWL